MKHVENRNKHIRKNVHRVGLFTKIILRCAVNNNIKNSVKQVGRINSSEH